MADAQVLIDWSRTWFATELAKGRAFESVRTEFNAASPLLVSLVNHVAASDRDQTDAMRHATGRAFARADG